MHKNYKTFFVLLEILFYEVPLFPQTPPTFAPLPPARRPLDPSSFLSPRFSASASQLPNRAE